MVIHGEDLDTWVKTARELNCAMIFDEFYSNYIWLNEDKPAMVSAAEYVEDVDKDPVVLLNGLTKIGGIPAGVSAGSWDLKTSSVQCHRPVAF